MKMYALVFIIFIFIPSLIAGTLVFIFSNETLIELSYFIFAILEIIIMIARSNRNDRLNMQEYGTTKVDKTSEIHKEFKRLQMILLSSATLNLILSYVAFVIFGVSS